MRQLQRMRGWDVALIHTGQHYDPALSDAFFEELQIPAPEVHLGVGSGTHGWQTGLIMQRLEPVLFGASPDLVVVVGDVNSTLAGALVAVKLQLPVAHVEAGLRSFDRTMPEEINRVVTDAVSTLLFCTEPSAVENLRREGIAEEGIHLVGNVMIDSMLLQRPLAERSDVLERFGLRPKGYVVLTLHRPSNVDEEDNLLEILAALEVIQERFPIIFPVHPRTRDRLATVRLERRLTNLPNLRLVDPLGYTDFLKLMMDSYAVLTDSGGIQEETTVLGVPCLTLRENTERPITIEQGTNRLAGTSSDSILAVWEELCSGRWAPQAKVPELWDGRAAERIAEVIAQYLGLG